MAGLLAHCFLDKGASMRSLMHVFALVLSIPLLCMPLNAPAAVTKSAPLLRIGYLPAVTQLPLVVAYENDRLNLKTVQVRLNRYNSYTAVEAALRVGAIDFASLPVPLVLNMAADGQPIKLLGADHVGGSRLVATQKGDLLSLRGHLVGLPGLDTSENIYLSQAMLANKLRPGLEYKTIRITFSTVIDDFKTGKLDAVYLPEPYGTIIESDKLAVAVDQQEGSLAGKLDAVWVVRAEFLDKNGPAVEEWLRSLAGSCRFIENDADKSGGRQTAIIQGSYFGFAQEVVTAALEKHAGGLKFAPVLPQIQALQDMSETASRLKILTKSVDLKSLVDLEPLRRISS
jgi:ABC-type nitrate/sulfonate/bicarbonate transport system substrate-binding protein